MAVDQQDPQKQLALVQLAQMRGGKLAASDRKAANDYFRKAASAARSYRELKKTPLNEMDLQGLSVVFYKEACAFASDNQPDKAMASLREAIDAGFSNVELLRTDQDLENLRARPDFQKLLADTRQRMQEQMQAEVRGEMAANKPFDFSFSLPDLQGKTVTLGDYKGKIVIVDIWGTWCPPCRMEVPHFIELYDKYRAQGLEMVGINYEEGAQEEWSKTITEFVKEQRINYPCLIGDDATQGRIANFQGFPTTLFIDREGVVRLMLVGYHPYEKLEAVVLELLAQASGSDLK